MAAVRNVLRFIIYMLGLGTVIGSTALAILSSAEDYWYQIEYEVENIKYIYKIGLHNQYCCNVEGTNCRDCSSLLQLTFTRSYGLLSASIAFGILATIAILVAAYLFLTSAILRRNDSFTRKSQTLRVLFVILWLLLCLLLVAILIATIVFVQETSEKFNADIGHRSSMSTKGSFSNCVGAVVLFALSVVFSIISLVCDASTKHEVQQYEKT